MHLTPMSRRRFGALSAAGLMAACATPRQVLDTDIQSALENHVAENDLAAAGIVVKIGSTVIASGAVGAAAGLSDTEQAAGIPVRPFTTRTPFRVASQSKSAVVLAAVRLAALGVIDLGADVSRYLDQPLKHPDSPGTPITLAMLLSHTSAIRDPATYWVAAPGRISEILGPDIYAPLNGRRPGAYFEYANLNFGLAATALEAAAGERFDLLMRNLLFAPAGLDVGFNWSGVPLEKRARGASLYRRDGAGTWSVQTDGPDALNGTAPTVLVEPGRNLSHYRLGTNGTLFSPQGGLRASLEDLVVLADLYADTPAMMESLWMLNADRSNGNHDDAFFQRAGLGLIGYSAEHSPLAGSRIWGHHGEAYGLHGAFWIVPDRAATIAYAAIGVPERRHPAVGHPGLNKFTAPLFRLASEAIVSA
ncbi:MAG: serine hydrolase domain-containing protein [Pseudomonadota bacterium]